MKKIFIIRHAKSSWKSNLIDFDRPLSLSGLESAKKVAEESLKIIDANSIILISSAKRTSETAKIFTTIWNLKFIEQKNVDELYTFNLLELEKIVKSCSNEFENIILFGHNSAITDFVNKFGDIFIENVPTSGFVSIIFDVDQWSSINNGKTNKIIFPRDI